ncbi:MAG: hypothetical protein LBK74_08110 [Treponema sp.]|nr:hypothetical protein [Treponema sp.]
MRIQSASALSGIGYALRASGGDRMSLPVSPASYIYSHFRHVSGIPAPEGTRGVAITRLKILDVLIEQLGQMKKQADFKLDTAFSDDQINSLIEKYEGQIKAARAANAAMPYVPAPQAPTGALFSLVA